MKRFLRSTWFLAAVALVLGLGTQTGVLAWRLGLIGEPSLPVEAGPVIPDRIVWDFFTPEIEQVQQELRQRLDTIANKEKELKDYELRLRAERAELEKLKRDIEGTRADIAQTITDVQVAEQKNLKTLAATYSNITPAAALEIFQQMQDVEVVKILSFMKPDPVGQILETMARTKDGEGTLAGRAAVISNKLRLIRQVRAGDNS